MKLKRRIVSAALVASMLLTGCGNQANGANEKNRDNKNSTATEANLGEGIVSGYESGSMVSLASIMDKYDAVATNSVEPMYNMAPDEKFDFNFKANIGMSSVSATDLVTVHTDGKCLSDSMLYTSNTYEETEDGGSRLTVAPISCPLKNQDNRDDYVDGSYTWGNAPIYYIAIWYDMDADELVKLEQPTIIPFTIKHEVVAPEVKGVVDELGCFSLQWEPVEGATEYRVYMYTDGTQTTGVSNNAINAAEYGYNKGSLVYIDTVDKDSTTFEGFAGGNENIVKMNRNMNGDEYVISQNPCVYGEYYVSAVVDGKESGFACSVPTSDLKIPYKPTEESDILFNAYTDVSQLPETINVINIDGSVTERKVMYEYKSVESYIEGLYLPEYYYTIEGTAIKGYVSMEIYDKDYDYPESIGESSNIGVTEPEDEIKSQPEPELENVPEDAGNDGSVIDDQIDQTKEDIDDAKEDEVKTPENNYIIFADTPAEEWLALHMVGGETEISLAAFPEFQVKESLIDIIEKVIYQNPYALGVCSYCYNYETKVLELTYAYSDEERETRQQEIYEKANEVIADVISKDMDNSQKQLALYIYLEENTAYDYDIVAKAEANNWKAMNDAESTDSFSTYGILVEGVGVCQSYAYTYKLLCTMAGLECDVVTGYISGNLPHAWNTVKIDDAWYQVDVTNSKNVSGVPFLLYNAGANTALATGYTESNMYEIDENIAQYYNESEELEYYNANGLVAESLDEYMEILSRELEENEKVIFVRYMDEMPEGNDIVDAVREVFYMANKENDLEKTSLYIRLGFLVVEGK